MKKLICLLICLLLLTGCVSSENKKTVRETVETYFNALVSMDYDKANSMVVSYDETISATIEKSNVNDVIFKDISYEIWNITEEEDGLLCADVVITQISLQAAYTDAVKEYALYVEEANAQNKKFTDEALEGKWNDIFYKYVSAVTEKVSLRCNVYIQTDDETPVILMTADLRNALFGGELDAIKALQKG